MTVMDFIFFALIGFGIVKGLYKGLLIQIASIAALLLGSYGAIYFSKYAHSALNKFLDWSEESINVFAFGITFLLIVFTIVLLGRAMTKLVNIISLGIINRLLGGVFGGFKISLMISVLILLLNNFNILKSIISKEEVKKSIFYTYVEGLAPKVYPALVTESNRLYFLNKGD